MPTVNIREFKARLSEFLGRAQRGETIVVANRNHPVVELRPIPARRGARVFGKPVAGLHVPPSFFEALPEEISSAFAGTGHE